MPRQVLYKKKNKESPRYARAAGAGLFLLLWFLAALAVGNPLLLPTPLDVLKSFFALLGETVFWQSLGRSLLGIVGGFALALLLSLAAGSLAFFVPPADLFFSPLLSICRSAPMAALTIILMIWLKASSLPFVLILLAITPPLYADTKAGLKAAPPKLLEMAFVFRFSKRDAFRYIYLPSLQRQLVPTLEYTAGLAWKAGITGEVLALPAKRLGTSLYEAKIQLESAEVLALLAVIVFLSRLLAKLLLKLLPKYGRAPGAAVSEAEEPAGADASLLEADALTETELLPREAPAAEMAEEAAAAEAGRESSADAAEALPAPVIEIENLNKSYDGKAVIRDLNAELPAGLITNVSGPSGRGKTTLFRMLLGLEEPDSGRIIFHANGIAGERVRLAASFQDGRLLEQLSGIDNLLAVSGLKDKREREAFRRKWEGEMRALGLPPEREVGFYSGGMKQKLSLLRTLASPSDILVLDEVFREVDLQSEKQMLALLARERRGRTLLLATHKPELARQLADFVLTI